MYDAQTTKDRIKFLCKRKKINMENMLISCDLGVNAIRQINDTKGMASFSLAKIADYLDCSVDYLLGRTDVPEVNRRDNLIPIYTAARSQNGQYSRAGVEYVDQETLNRLRNAPETDEDL